MYEEELAQLEDYAARFQELRRCLNIDALKEEIARLEAQTSVDGFWNDPEAAQKVMQRIKNLKTTVEEPERLGTELEDVRVLLDLARAEQDESMVSEITAELQKIAKKIDQLEITSLFSDPRDSRPAIVNIHPGAGGTESCDWASMLYRMIVRYCERKEFTVELMDYQPGEEAGLKSATLSVEGPFAYGYLKSEEGVHRLVRISPFDANSRRHTSFAAIEVVPQLDESIQIEIKEEDIRMETFRSSGPGGQKVNKTSSAVRLIHIPSGIVVACQIERSQHRNRAVAMEMLKARLYDREMKKKEAERIAGRENQMDVAWGSQIRSYVLHPYQMVKDHRTEVETSNVDRVLDGEIDLFVEAFLKLKLSKRADASV
ncbi:MAG TPA: peptide chain release factor 2 [Candidatus Hydrogenedentes bacterium]|nr:peptide chain release factor 2 [Candidatus Hydrogenedentota bacterium]HOL76100.1 peptide chain release factor 2 [Candidatus Hydrogenedentota bacterium]HPO84714.1 peptide chain release factor 2 [Candidatus Hydrogenedentota bacterium]